MRERFGELELLAFIEDEMSPRRRAAFAARLEQEPGLRDRVDRMRRDRAALRALPEPELPVDFMVALEPQLARSMLVSPPPGAYRRRHRRPGRHPWVRFGVAAAFAGALLAGVWGAAVLVPRIMNRPGATPGAGVAATGMGDAGRDGARDGSRPSIAPGIAAGETDLAGAPGPGEPVAWPPADATVHHRAPLPARRGASPDAATATAVAAAPAIPEAPLALVVPAADARDGEALVERIVAGLAVPAGADRARDVRGALVRNFDLKEAQRLVRRIERERIAAGGEPDRYAGVDGAAGRATNDPAARRRLLDRLRRIGDADGGGDDDPRAGVRLLGPRELAPGYERQLELSALGATHTVTLPVDRLAGFLARLRVAEGRLTSLRPLAPDADADATGTQTDLQRWVEHHAMIRDFAADLGVQTGETYVMLPVVIEVSR